MAEAAKPTIVTLADPEALAQHVVVWLTDLALAAPGRFAVSLSGGSTPKRMFEILAEPANAARFPWEKVHFFWGDERFVPYDRPESNLRMTREALLNHVNMPAANIHPMPTDGDPAEAAARYEAELKAFYGSDTLDNSRPLFDVMFLGLGENGHTASLFPETDVLLEREKWVVPISQNVPQTRLTLTYPAIECSARVAFLVAGASKATVLKQVLDGDTAQPATQVRAAGELIWFTDEAAAKNVLF
jgi:6-phosphogluconolactonase